MKKTLLNIVLSIFITWNGLAQQIKITALFESNEPPADSSYYDGIVFNNDHIWFVGKHGIITELKNNVQRRIKHPDNKELNFLAAASIDNQNYILTCDQGTIYYYNNEKQEWNSQQIKGYEKKCFYSVLVLNDKEFLICGGNSKIAKSEKAIPQGFILKTIDGGKTWNKVFQSNFKMAWRLKKDNNNHIWVNLYRPNKSFLFFSADNGNTWKKSSIVAPGLIHDFYIEENYSILAGGKGINDRNSSHALINRKPSNFIELGFIWEIKEFDDKIWLSAGNSCVAYKLKENQEWKIIKLNEQENRNIYRIIKTNVNTFYAFGSGKRIYKITLNE